MSEQIDQLATVAVRLDEVYAITSLLAEQFNRSTPSKADMEKAFAITGDLVFLVCDIMRQQKNSIMETIEALHIFSLEHEATVV